MKKILTIAMMTIIIISRAQSNNFYYSTELKESFELEEISISHDRDISRITYFDKEWQIITHLYFNDMGALSSIRIFDSFDKLHMRTEYLPKQDNVIIYENNSELFRLKPTKDFVDSVNNIAKQSIIALHK